MADNAPPCFFERAQAAVGNQRLYFLCKRCMDIVVSSAALVVGSPFLLLIALLIKLDSPGPVLFKQKRIRLRNRSAAVPEAGQFDAFIMFKFRTMYQDSSPVPHEQLVKAMIRGDKYDLSRVQLRGGTVVNKLGSDRRITRTGKYLRRTNLDELPQLWNVLRGDMSLVGPRPPLPYEVTEYQPHHWKRLGAKPGCVGLWQVSGRNTLGFDDMVNLDVWYIEHQSLWLDLKIVLQVASAVLSGKGGG